MLRGHCLELGGVQIPYAPLVAALRPIARDGAELTADLPAATRNALGELLPELGGTPPGEADEEHRARQGRLFEALLTLLERLGRDAPVLLMLEDVHWADSSTRDFVTFLVRSAREEPLCLVVTYRSDELHRRHPLRPLIAELERAAGVERIALERFDRDEVVQQLEGILQEPVPADLADRLYGRSQGNALYTEELLAASDDGWLLPETLRDALLTRVEKLSPAAQGIVRAAAVLDRPISHGLLEELSDLDAAQVMEGAREAVAHQVLVGGRRRPYSFRHALVGEAIHGDLLPGEDTALHRRVAQALEERPSCSATCRPRRTRPSSPAIGAPRTSWAARSPRASRPACWPSASTPTRRPAAITSARSSSGPAWRMPRRAPGWTAPRSSATPRPAPTPAARRRARWR